MVREYTLRKGAERRMSTQYLVDYENVHEAGLYGMDTLTAEDSVFIFHTSQNDRITLSRLDNVQAWVKVILVPPGKQSLDMHLGSFLGYLIGKDDAETHYAIVSHDRDFRGIADFWNSTFRSADKVRCIHGIKYSTGVANPDVWVSTPTDYSAQRSVVREFILKLFSKYGKCKLFDAPCMLVSDLCTRLNNLPEYNNERKRTGKKPMQYLADECQDIIWLRKQWGQDWAFLLTVQVGESSPAVTKSEKEEALSEAPAIEEDVPDIMEIGDLSIGDEHLLSEEPTEDAAALMEKEKPTDIRPADDGVQTVTEPEATLETDLLTAALEFIRKAEDTEKNASGHIRASALRDALMSLSEFRISLKESGMKPIPFIQQLFTGEIEIYREKGTYWASTDAQKAECPADAENRAIQEKGLIITERKKYFFEIAFKNIQKRLTDAGMDQNVADEIAGICMRTDSAEEPRKVIHMLLCQRFGPKIGAKYYRQTVKYISA